MRSTSVSKDCLKVGYEAKVGQIKSQPSIWKAPAAAQQRENESCPTTGTSSKR